MDRIRAENHDVSTNFSVVAATALLVPSDSFMTKTFIRVLATQASILGNLQVKTIFYWSFQKY